MPSASPFCSPLRIPPPRAFAAPSLPLHTFLPSASIRPPTGFAGHFARPPALDFGFFSPPLCALAPLYAVTKAPSLTAVSRPFFSLLMLLFPTPSSSDVSCAAPHRSKGPWILASPQAPRAPTTVGLAIYAALYPSNDASRIPRCLSHLSVAFLTDSSAPSPATRRSTSGASLRFWPSRVHRRIPLSITRSIAYLTASPNRDSQDPSRCHRAHPRLFFLPSPARRDYVLRPSLLPLFLVVAFALSTLLFVPVRVFLVNAPISVIDSPNAFFCHLCPSDCFFRRRHRRLLSLSLSVPLSLSLFLSLGPPRHLVNLWRDLIACSLPARVRVFCLFLCHSNRFPYPAALVYVSLVFFSFFLIIFFLSRPALLVSGFSSSPGFCATLANRRMRSAPDLYRALSVSSSLPPRSFLLSFLRLLPCYVSYRLLLRLPTNSRSPPFVPARPRSFEPLPSFSCKRSTCCR